MRHRPSVAPVEFRRAVRRFSPIRPIVRTTSGAPLSVGIGGPLLRMSRPRALAPPSIVKRLWKPDGTCPLSGARNGTFVNTLMESLPPFVSHCAATALTVPTNTPDPLGVNRAVREEVLLDGVRGGEAPLNVQIAGVPNVQLPPLLVPGFGSMRARTNVALAGPALWTRTSY